MNISKECYLCIYKQIFNITKKFNLDDKKASKVLREGAKILSKYDIDVVPPLIAAEEYRKIEEILDIDDLFYKEKKLSIKEALKFKPYLKEKLKLSSDKLFDACKVAVGGNVIDFGVHHEFSLEEEIKKIFDIEFKKNDYNEFKQKLVKANTLCYLADNAGENIFDEILIEVIKEFNKHIKIYYVVRGKPIINDVTIKDLEGLEIWNLAEVIDSGVDSPGFLLNKANKTSKEIFYNSDIVISKGMGNFECLYEEANREVFYFYKVKCEVVARKSNAEVGDYMLFKGDR